MRASGLGVLAAGVALGQLSGKPVGAQSDLWSLAVVALKALTGKNPYERPTIPETIGAVVHGDLPVPSALAAGLPVGVDAWFARACARDPTRRFGSSNALAEALWEAIGMPKAVVSSPSASGAPLVVPAATTVSITPSEPITEGTLRSVGGRVPPSLTPEPIATRSSRAPVVLVGIAALALVAGLSFALGSVTTPPVPRLGSALRQIAARAAEVAPRARREPKPSEVVLPVTPSATAKPGPKRSVAGRPKAKDDDDLGF